MINELQFLSASLSDLTLALVVASLIFLAWYFTTDRWLVPVLGAIALTAVGIDRYSYVQLADRYDAQQEDQALEELADVSRRLDSTLEARIVEARALAAHLANNPDLDAAGYSAFLNDLLAEPHYYTNVAAAPGMRITRVFPLEGNEPALGLFYPEVESQWPMIQRAMETREPVLIGPIELVQGGQGFIIHQGVFPENADPWGVIASVIPLPAILDSAGISELGDRYRVSVRAVDAAGDPSQRVWSTEEPPNTAWAARRVLVPNGVWEFQLEPREQLLLPAAVHWGLHTVVAALALITGGVTIILVRARRRAREHQETLGLTAWLLDEAQRLGGMGSWELAPGERQCQLSPQLQELMQCPGRLDINDWGDWVAPQEAADLQSQLDSLMTGRADHLHLEHWLRTPVGQRRIVHTAERITTRRRQGEFRIVGTLLDVTEQKKAADELERLAFIDSLTGTPNRHRFQLLFSEMLSRHESTGEQMALLHIDLDHFKDINDSLGHQVGDAVLRICSRRIAAALSPETILGRTGGDEFMAVIPSIDHRTDAADVSERIIQKFRLPVVHNSHEVYVGASIGIALFPDDARDFETMYQCADLALYETKAQGRGSFRYYQQELASAFHRRTQLENAMQYGFQRSEYWLAYQPRFELTTGEVTGIEALLRWNNPALGMIPPDEFVPIAEQSGFIVPLGQWVIDQAIAEFAGLQEMLDPSARLSINLSPRQILQPELTDHIEAALNRHQMSPRQLDLEITETFLVTDKAQCQAFMQRLSGKGVSFSLDDFGTGYSNLSTLEALPLRTLKIDKSFIQRSWLEPSTEALVQTIVRLGNSLRMTVVAEGVETPDIEQTLIRLGCHEVQGYLRARPMTRQALAEFLLTPPESA